MKFPLACTLLVLAVGDRPAPARAEGGAFAPSGVCRPDTVFYPSPKFLNFEVQAVTLGMSRINCGLGRLTTASPRTVYIDYADNSAGQISCSLSLDNWDQTRNLFWETKKSPANGRAFFSFSIPSQLTGYVTILCDLPQVVGSESASRFYGINFQ